MKLGLLLFLFDEFVLDIGHEAMEFLWAWFGPGECRNRLIAICNILVSWREWCCGSGRLLDQMRQICHVLKVIIVVLGSLGLLGWQMCQPGGPRVHALGLISLIILVTQQQCCILVALSGHTHIKVILGHTAIWPFGHITMRHKMWPIWVSLERAIKMQ